MPSFVTEHLLLLLKRDESFTLVVFVKFENKYDADVSGEVNEEEEVFNDDEFLFTLELFDQVMPFKNVPLVSLELKFDEFDPETRNQ